MIDEPVPASVGALRSGMPAWGKAVVGLLLVIAAAVVWVLDDWLSASFTETTRNRAELRLVLYAGNIEAELQRTQVVPILLARDPLLRDALENGNYTSVTQLLIGLQDDVGAASIELLDISGRVVGATDRVRLGMMRSSDTLFVDARSILPGWNAPGLALPTRWCCSTARGASSCRPSRAGAGAARPRR